MSRQRKRSMIRCTCAAVIGAVPPPSRRSEPRSKRSKSGTREQRVEHRRHRVEVRHALALDRLEDGARLGLRHDHRRRPGVPEAERQCPAAHVEHREHAEPDVVLAEAELQVRRRRLQPVAAVREQRALRRAGGAAGVEHDVRIVLVDLDRDVVRRLRVGEGREARPSGVARVDGDERAAPAAARRRRAARRPGPRTRRRRRTSPPRRGSTTFATSAAVKRAFTGTTIAPSLSAAK